jgi:Polyglycine hydrolase-like, structural repeat
VQQLRIQAIPLADDDGKRKYTFTQDNLAKGVARANKALAHAGVELVFDPKWDWTPRNDTTMNNEDNSGSNWWVHGNQIASKYPGKIVIFFRHGPGKDAVGWGHAYPPNTGQTVPPIVPLPTDDVKYVSLPNARDWDTADNGNFIGHEVGHYLGLFHTHPGWGTSDLYPSTADTAAKAEQALVDFAAAHGGAPGAFNGDLLSDTSPDCCRNIYSLRGLAQDSSGPASVTIKGTAGGKQVSFTLTPPRDNLMSYFFWGAPQTLTAKQKATVQKTLQSDHRKILIEPPCLPDFHGVPVGSFQLCFDYWRNRGLEPKTLSCTETHIAGSFQSGHRMPVWIQLTSAEYQQRFDQYFAQDLRPARVTVAETGAGARYTGIWRSIEASFHSDHRMTIGDFDKEWHAKRKAGWLNTDLYIYRDGGKLLASATWVKKHSDDYATYYGMTKAEYEQKRKDYGKKGLVVTCFCAYTDGDQRRYCAIWEKLPGSWPHWFNMTSADYQQKYDEHAAKGYHVHQIQAYAGRYSAIWKKP